jgi:hypothetical protein
MVGCLRIIWRPSESPPSKNRTSRNARAWACRPPACHFEIGEKLAPLRDEGMPMQGKGNVVHNLELLRRGEDFAYDWAAAHWRSR